MFLVSFDSEIRLEIDIKIVRISESGHQQTFVFVRVLT